MLCERIGRQHVNRFWSAELIGKVIEEMLVENRTIEDDLLAFVFRFANECRVEKVRRTRPFVERLQRDVPKSRIHYRSITLTKHTTF
jgi:hypothetical protein